MTKNGLERNSMVVRVILIVMSLWTCPCLPQTGKNITNLSEGQPTTCHHKFSFMSSTSGIFMSPNFPEKYQNELNCVFFFQSAENGRIKIKFDLFNLEASNSDKGCQFDYIEIFNIDPEGFKVLMDRYCGDRAPKEFISQQSKLEIKFSTDFTKTLHGFIGHYEFLDENWHHFGLSTIGCGEGYHTGKTGEITSPDYPGNPKVSRSRCTWIINVQDNENILITMKELDFSSFCSETFLMFFNGFTVPGAYPDERYCGKYNYEPHELEFISDKSRMIIRYSSNGPVASAKFRLVWTAVTKAENGQCDQLLCQETRPCILQKNNACKTTFQLCIDQSMMCNGLSNCGVSDETDETQCFNRLIYFTIYVIVPIIAILLILVLAVVSALMCYRRRRRKQNVINMESQKPPQTHWVSPHIRSSEDPSSMTSQSATLLTTSFVSDNAFDEDATIDRRRKIQNRTIENIKSSEMFNKRKEKDKPPDYEGYRTGSNSDDENGEIVTHSIQLEPQIQGSGLRTHKKRSSYHMMQELTIENNAGADAQF